MRVKSIRMMIFLSIIYPQAPVRAQISIGILGTR